LIGTVSGVLRGHVLLSICKLALTSLFFIIILGMPERFGAFARSAELPPGEVAQCHEAIELAARQTGVPRDILLAISLTETGKKIAGRISPWPWTVNMEGAGVWFQTRAQALAYVEAHFHRGARSFDVGCFQINYKWHHQHFRSIEEMFDPRLNALYAAKFLTDLYQETGSWSTAAGYYHSRTPKFASRYSERFARHLANIAGGNLPGFEGHGSEALQLANSEVERVRPDPVWPLKKLGHLPPTEIISSRPTGSLVRLDGGPSLLTATTRPMF
jgi:hypothetical protein